MPTNNVVRGMLAIFNLACICYFVRHTFIRDFNSALCQLREDTNFSVTRVALANCTNLNIECTTKERKNKKAHNEEIASLKAKWQEEIANYTEKCQVEHNAEVARFDKTFELSKQYRESIMQDFELISQHMQELQKECKKTRWGQMRPGVNNGLVLFGKKDSNCVSWEKIQATLKNIKQRSQNFDIDLQNANNSEFKSRRTDSHESGDVNPGSDSFQTVKILDYLPTLFIHTAILSISSVAVYGIYTFSIRSLRHVSNNGESSLTNVGHSSLTNVGHSNEWPGLWGRP